MILSIRNTLTNTAPKTYLSQPTAAGGTTSYLRNINDFADLWAIQIGETGHENTEVVNISGAPSTGTTNHGAVDYGHPTDTPVYAIKYDQVIFKESTSGTAGTATAITSGTVSYTPDSGFTQFDYTSGSSSSAYKASFLSTGLSSESPDSGWLTSSGFSIYSLGKLRQRIKDKSIIELTDGQIDDWVNEWYQELRNTAVNVDEDYFLGSVDVSYSGTAELGTITDANYIRPRRVWLTNDGNTWHRATKIDINRIEPNQTYFQTSPYYYVQSENVIGRLPADSDGTARIIYFSMGTVLSEDTDELPNVMRPYTKSFIDYVLSQAAKVDNRPSQAIALEQQAGTARDDFKFKISPLDQSGNETLEIVEEW